MQVTESAAPTSVDAAGPGPRLEVRQMSKSFGYKPVLSDVEITVGPGEIRGVIGQNGSGKSTLAKILSGVYSPDSGSIVRVDGEPVTMPAHLAELRRVGISVVHQDLGLIPEFSVLQNIRIGHSHGGRLSGRISWEREATPARETLVRLGADAIPLGARVDELAPADMAKVAIARSLQGAQPGRGVLIFDESTRALPADDLAEFYAVVRELARTGITILVVSHRLSEVLELCDSVTVLRDGRVVTDGAPTAGLDEEALARLMLGKALNASTVDRESESEQRHVQRSPIARITKLSVPGTAGSVDLDLYAGEIVGLTGRPGTVFEQLPAHLAGSLSGAHGVIAIQGHAPIDLARASIRQRLDRGLVVVPEKRIRDGLALSESVLSNLTLPHLRRRARWWNTGDRWRVREAQAAIEKYDIRPPDHRINVGKMSGGNQQKVMLAKWLAGAPQLLVLHEPTQAVDIQAREDILAAVAKAAADGCAVLLVSTEISDLVRISDRVLVVADDGMPRPLDGAIDEDAIVAQVYGK
jgi:ribose transport system ATP-binding protein